ncbi:oxidoreductase [Pseudoclavibacter sp. RFBI5]|uniref:NADH:flavin oxidoreductase/NADH oxidase n=1 Tax=Pseudoclavibacter sp. RFBI5 TaxID=2080578 RepID=UPI000CE73403|nr:NADH:flavin oxidoreductase/NADH oxidase [Pseudoclavibacter sp. RFBI5]PPG02586.1 oxidoreductase [Pseudoclavibacter sp. RFBI5]
MSRLLSPVTLPSMEGGGLPLRNATFLAPMCQYSVTRRDGLPTSWQLVHLGARASGGFGLVWTEATAIVPEGRISPEDTGIWSDEHTEAWRPIVDFLHEQGAAAGIQLGHAGGKASAYPALPETARGTVPADEGGWSAQAPSSTDVFGLAAPAELTVTQISDLVTDWGRAARRSDDAGFDALQIHAAHGYLLHEFLSPLSNERTDEYGGSFENRTRFVLEVVAEVRRNWPAEKPLAIRFSGEDWVEGGWTIAETVDLAKLVHELGVTVFDLSSGGIGAFTGPVGPGYQVSLARAVREALPAETAFVTAVGQITEARHAEAILVGGDADGITIGRAALANPNWPVHAAVQLGDGQVGLVAPQYWRATMG